MLSSLSPLRCVIRAWSTHIHGAQTRRTETRRSTLAIKLLSRQQRKSGGQSCTQRRQHRNRGTPATAHALILSHRYTLRT